MCIAQWESVRCKGQWFNSTCTTTVGVDIYQHKQVKATLVSTEKVETTQGIRTCQAQCDESTPVLSE